MLWVAALVVMDAVWLGEATPTLLHSLFRASVVTALVAPILLWGWYRDPEVRELVALVRRLRRK